MWNGACGLLWLSLAPDHCSLSYLLNKLFLNYAGQTEGLCQWSRALHVCACEPRECGVCACTSDLPSPCQPNGKGSIKGTWSTRSLPRAAKLPFLLITFLRPFQGQQSLVLGTHEVRSTEPPVNHLGTWLLASLINWQTQGQTQWFWLYSLAIHSGQIQSGFTFPKYGTTHCPSIGLPGFSQTLQTPNVSRVLQVMAPFPAWPWLQSRSKRSC